MMKYFKPFMSQKDMFHPVFYLEISNLLNGFLILSAPGYFCLTVLRREAHSVPLPKSWWENAFGIKFGAVIIYNVTKKWEEIFFKSVATGIMTSIIISIFFLKLCDKWLKQFFSKINLVTGRKKFFKIFCSFWISRLHADRIYIS